MGEGLVERDPTEGLDVDVKPARAKTALPPETIAAYLDAALVEPEVRRSPDVRRALALRNRAVLERRIVWTVTERVGLRSHPHAFRRSTATGLVKNGASVVAVKELLGHKRLDTTQRYVATSLDDVRRAVELLDEGGAARRRS